MYNCSFTGRRISILGILLFFCSGIAISQPVPKLFDHAVPAFQSSPVGSGTVHVIAVMVEFQTDDNRFTSGNGSFDLPYLNRDDIIIDPLPHDQAYFEAHLEFARNYFNAASNGQLQIEYTVLPQVYRLPNEMKAYSPTGPDNSENYKLGNLARDTWELVAQSELPSLPNTSPERTLFIIFHAGAGRDIELVGTTLDNTPQDIPSVYLSKNAIARLTDNPGFDGFPLGDLNVTNSAILPQTQSRRGEDVTGMEFVLQLSINGILTANIGSFLGVPDLFNTSTGASGIGRFGLMDGAGIFSYYGLFPPLPSAWERAYMGWDTPFDITMDESEFIELPAVSLPGDRAVARHYISSDEYFLVENRHRDPLGTGVELTFQLPDGTTETRVFDNSEERFNPFDQRKYDEILPSGVLINVSNFDWSLPGGLDAGEDQVVGTDDDRLLNGGMLIWHIDDAVIRSKMADNTINNNPDRPGVALQEADGVQDINRPAGTLSNFANGGPFDFWWSGNNFTVITATGQRIVLYENRFADDTYPNNRSNTGSISYFEFFDFSDNLPVAGFRARPANPGLAELVLDTRLERVIEISETQSIENPIGLSFYKSGNDEFLVIPGSSKLLLMKLDGEGVPDVEELHELNAPADVQVYSDGPLIYAWQDGNEIRVVAREWAAATQNFTLLWESSVNGELSGRLSSADGHTIDLDGTPIRMNGQNGDVQIVNGGFQSSGIMNGAQVTIIDNLLEFSGGPSVLLDGLGESSRQYAGLVEYESGKPPAAFLLRDESLRMYFQSDINDSRLITESGNFSWPALTDLNNDWRIDFIYTDYFSNSLEARNINGAHLWNFPKNAPDGIRYSGTPLVADITGNDSPEILIQAVDSLSVTIRAYDHRMQLLDGFPLYVGSLNSESPDNRPVHMLFRDNKLYAVSNTGDLKVWKFNQAGLVLWGGVYGNMPGNKIGGTVGSAGITAPEFSLLNPEETYNWPNPAGEETWIRFETNGQAEVDISVITMSGSRMYEHRTYSRGGVPEEVRVNTSSWDNGVYYARVKATQNGQSETRLIKIAVMH